MPESGRVGADEMACGSYSWHCLQTAPNVEARVMGDVSAEGYRCHLPRYVVRQRRYGRVETVVRPLFPSYLLVAFDALTAPWGALLRLRDVRRFLTTSAGHPATIRHGEVEHLMAMGRAGDGAIDDAVVPFPVGATARVLDGAFEAHAGVCQWSTAQRVGLLLSMLGRDVSVAFDRNQVIAA